MDTSNYTYHATSSGNPWRTCDDNASWGGTFTIPDSAIVKDGHTVILNPTFHPVPTVEEVIPMKALFDARIVHIESEEVVYTKENIIAHNESEVRTKVLVEYAQQVKENLDPDNYMVAVRMFGKPCIPEKEKPKTVKIVE